MIEPRIIKRYPNRRLYDPATSQYVTLDEIKKLVLNHIPFKVIDQRTDTDYTNEVLLKIITEEENHAPIFTTHILENIIRFYGNPMQGMLTAYLEKLTEFTKNNLSSWESMFSNYFKSGK